MFRAAFRSLGAAGRPLDRFSAPRGEILFRRAQIFFRATQFSSEGRNSLPRGEILLPSGEILLVEPIFGTAVAIFRTGKRFSIHGSPRRDCGADFRFAERKFGMGRRNLARRAAQLFAEYKIAPRSRCRFRGSLPLSPERPLDDRVQTREGGVHGFASVHRSVS